MPQPHSQTKPEASALSPEGQARQAALADWFARPLGQQALRTEGAMLDELLPGLFGYHLIQLSVQPAPLYQSSQIQHKMAVSLSAGPDAGPGAGPDAGIVASPASLPFESGSVDLVILHHLLDFIESPIDVLREISRVTISMGNLIVIGFNPLSLWGAWRLFGRLRGRMPWAGRFIRPGRLMEWLNLLDFKIDRAQYALYGPPVARFAGGVGNYAGGLSRHANLPTGAIYVIAARKQVAAMTPMKPVWGQSRAFGRLSLVRSVKHREAD